jgi:hypothetical protein
MFSSFITIPPSDEYPKGSDGYRDCTASMPKHMVFTRPQLCQALVKQLYESGLIGGREDYEVFLFCAPVEGE